MIRMAIDSKTNFLNQFEKQLSMVITANTMTQVLSIAADVMESFDMREIVCIDEQDDMLECFIDAMNVQNRSQKTISNYRIVLRKFMEETNVPVRRITVYHLRSFITKLKERGLKDSTINHYREVFSSYFGWLFREGLIEKNPVANLGTIKVPKKEKKIFSDVEMETLRQGCKKLRDKAIVTFLAATGCRVAELCGLNRNDIDFLADGKQCIVKGKGNKERVVYMDSVTSMYLRNYLETRTDSCEALFVTKNNERFQTGGIRDMLKRLEAVTGVDHVHPHKFRRTLATNMAKRNMPIQTIAAILGHESIETTMEYIVLNREDNKLKYNQYYAS